LPLLLNAGSARVINLSSDGHKIFDIDLDDPNWEQGPYDKFKAYGAAKTANVLFTVALEARYREERPQELRRSSRHRGHLAVSLHVKGRHEGDDGAGVG